MNKDRERGAWRGRLSRKIALRYILALAAYAVGLAVFVLTAWNLCSQIVWYPENLVYRLLNLVKEYILFWIALALLAGWVVITDIFFRIPLRYLDAVVEQAGKLAAPSAEPLA